MKNSKVGKISHILSFDVEEYFDVELAFRAGISDLSQFPSRIRIGMNFLLNLLAERNTKATFFILGRLAKQNKQLIKEIASAGHELACHSMNHKMITQISPKQFHKDTISCKKLIEDIIGHCVIGYRAPTFSITERTLWAFDKLIEAGFEYDSSVYPIKHDIYGIRNTPATIHWAITPSGNRILELPIMTRRILNMNFPTGGGGYFRLLPLSLILNSIRKYEQQNKPAVLYFHPWEFDANQPVLPMPFPSRIRHRIGLRKTQNKLKQLLQNTNFSFTSVANILNNLKQTRLEFDYGKLNKEQIP